MFSWLFAKPLPPGSAAPDFSLRDDAGREVTLSGLRGRWVALVFYPGDDTPGCTKQLCEFRDHWSAVQARGIQVFGVNPQDARSHTRFREKFGFPFPLLVDRGRKVAALYHAGGPIVRRTVYLIGPDGNIRLARRGMPKPAELIELAG
ncbi:MAG TPA: peroxiredoxin [Bryobacteraceae bacterium]|nr:peroxiredoxin [Bryobacteraceae bacterium]